MVEQLVSFWRKNILLRAVVLAIAYYLFARLGRSLSFPGQDFATFWPPAGLMMAALAMSPPRNWPAYLAAGILANTLFNFQREDMQPWLCVTLSFAYALEAVFGAWLLQKIRGREFRLETMIDALSLCTIGALFGTMIGAAVGASILTLGMRGPPLLQLAELYWQNWYVWWIADAVGVLVIGPLIAALPFTGGKGLQLGIDRVAEAFVAYPLLIVVSAIAFGPWYEAGASLLTYPFLAFPLLAWAGSRFGARGAALASLLAGLIAVWGTTRGYGFYVRTAAPLVLQASILQFYLIVVSVTPLLFAMLLRQQELTSALLQEANEELESRVAERTAELVRANEQLRHEMGERLRTSERLREQQAQLAHALRLRTLGEMAAELAHEVNQPLSAVSNYVRGMQRRVQGDAITIQEVVPTLELIGRETQRAADVIRRAKRFISTQQPTREKIDLGALVRDALKLIEFEARERQVQVSVDLAGEPLLAVGDSLQVEQVIVNLVRNAFEALGGVEPTRRKLHLSASRHQDAVEISIEDSGPGLPAEQFERIFEAFYTTKPEGLGLGLPISRSIMEAHGGRLWAEASSLGGATFRFTLPIWDEDHGCESKSE